MLGQPTSNLLTGQAKIAVANTAVQLNSAIGLQNGVTIKADKNNTGTVSVGGASTVNDTGGGTGNGFMLYPGDTVSIAVTALSFMYVSGANVGDFVTWAAN